MAYLFYPITPTAAPRQVKKDAWRPSPAVERYRTFRDDVGWRKVQLPVGFFHVVFFMPMPKSWSETRKARFAFRPHERTPDKDNLEKALVDAVYRGRSDAHVWHSASTKLWSFEAAILISDRFIQALGSADHCGEFGCRIFNEFEPYRRELGTGAR